MAPSLNMANGDKNQQGVEVAIKGKVPGAHDYSGKLFWFGVSMGVLWLATEDVATFLQQYQHALSKA